ncbi:hypothetical protein EC991_002357 [Linnemannia zychae]|nr:hypothetical protein EC991_002357 [Linnemannia zychae]
MIKFTILFLITIAVLAPFSAAMPIAESDTFDPTIPHSKTIKTVAPLSSFNLDSILSDPELVDAGIDAFSSDIMHEGKATWFTDGYGACNEIWNGEEELIVALNAHQMGPRAWDNPVCGRWVHIREKWSGISVKARIVDKCPGNECAWGSLDLSPAAFRELGDQDTGILDIEWNYI